MTSSVRSQHLQAFRRPWFHFTPYLVIVFCQHKFHSLPRKSSGGSCVNTFMFFHFLTNMYTIIYILNSIYGGFTVHKKRGPEDFCLPKKKKKLKLGKNKIWVHGIKQELFHLNGWQKVDQLPLWFPNAANPHGLKLCSHKPLLCVSSQCSFSPQHLYYSPNNSCVFACFLCTPDKTGLSELDSSKPSCFGNP